MNIRCAFCQTPYTLSRVQILDAMQEVDAGKLSHYDAHCPRCRRATRLPRQKLEMAMPNWKEQLKQFEKEMKQNPQQEAPLPTAEAAPAVEAAPAPEPVPAKQPAKAKAAPAEKKTAEKKPAAKATAKKSK